MYIHYLLIPEREHVCPPAGVQLQLPTTNKTVTVTHNIDILPIAYTDTDTSSYLVVTSSASLQNDANVYLATLIWRVYGYFSFSKLSTLICYMVTLVNGYKQIPHKHVYCLSFYMHTVEESPWLQTHCMYTHMWLLDNSLTKIGLF